MSKLFNKPPASIRIDSCEYEINTDFRVWIEIEKLLCSRAGNSFEKFADCLCLAYKTLPPNPSGALEGLLYFYSLGRQSTAEQRGGAPQMPLYDLEADSEYIYSAFMSQYGIDLSEAELHWWKFRALFSGLDDNCRFAKIVSYRSTDTQSIKDAAARRFYEKMKRLYALPDNRTEEERSAALCESIAYLF